MKSNKEIISNNKNPSDNNADNLLVKTLIASKSHVGPIPSPEALEKYNHIITNGANRIMLMAEKEQANRHKIENKATNIEVYCVVISALLLILCITIAAILGFKGVDYKIVVAFLGIPVLSAITALIKKVPGKKSKKD